MQNQLLYQGTHTNLSLEEHEDLGKVVVKSLNDEFPTPQVIENFLHEYELCKDLNLSGVRKALAWEKKKQSHRIYMEYVDGITLSEYILTKIKFEKDQIKLLFFFERILEFKTFINLLKIPEKK